MLEFKGSAHLRHRLLLSLLSSKPVRITDIRSDAIDPGLLDYEVRFLRMLERLTNGTTIEIGPTGTVVTFRPGSIYGGELDFDCGTERSIVYFLEPLLLLAPFSKLAFSVTLRGLTADAHDQTVDGLKNASLRLLARFGVEEGVDFRIKRRGAAPLGGGEVFFTCPIVPHLRAAVLDDVGKIKRIRGVASTVRVSPQLGRRMIEAVRGKFNPLLPDVHIILDAARGVDSGLSPGYSLFLQAESTTGALLTADGVGVPNGMPEDVGTHVSKLFLREIKRGGYVGQRHQWMALLLMALCPTDLSRIALGPLTESIRGALIPDIKTFLGVSFRTETAPRSSAAAVVVSCVGSGFENLNRRIQ